MSYFDKRIGNQSSKLSKDLLQLVERKQSNLCVSVDFNTKDSLLKMVEAVGPYVCMIKVRLSFIHSFTHTKMSLIDSCRHYQRLRYRSSRKTHRVIS